jgi:hypothetical protein
MMARLFWLFAALLLCTAKAFGQPTGGVSETTGTLLMSGGKTKRNAPISAITVDAGTPTLSTQDHGDFVTSTSLGVDLDAMDLQAVTDNGNVTTNSIEADSFTGDGPNLTALNASNIASGNLSMSRMPSTGSGVIWDCLDAIRIRDTVLDSPQIQVRNNAGNTYVAITPSTITGLLNGFTWSNGNSIHVASGLYTNVFIAGQGNVIGDNLLSNRDVHAERNAYVRNVLVVGDGRQMLGQSDGTLVWSLGDNTSSPTPYTTTTVCVAYPAADGMYFKTGAIPGYSGTGGNQFKFDNDIWTTGSIYTSGTLTTAAVAPMVATKSALFTADNTTSIYYCSGTYTITLPTPTTAGRNMRWTFKNTDGGTQTIDPAGGVLIDGAANYPSNTINTSVDVCSDGTNYFIH